MLNIDDLAEISRFFYLFDLQDTGKYVFGVDETLKALEMGAVDMLICWENLNVTRYVLRNHATGVDEVLHLRPDEEKDKTHFKDPEVRSCLPLDT